MFKIDVNRLPKLEKKEFPTIKETTKKKMQSTAIMNKNKNIEVGKVDLPMMGAGSTIPSRLRTPAQKEIADRQQLKAMSNSPVARFAYGAAEGIHPLGHEDKTQTQKDIKTVLDNTTAGKAGKITGQVAQFAFPYAGAAPAIGKTLLTIPKVAKMGRAGQAIARSAATDLAVGLPLNANIALNKEGLRGEDALKNIALNTGIDLVAGGALEVIGGVILKNGRKVATKSDFDALPAPEKEETILMLQAPEVETKLLAEGVNWRAPNQPDYYVNRGGAASPDAGRVNIAGELPAPANTFSPIRRTLAKQEPPKLDDAIDALIKKYNITDVGDGNLNIRGVRPNDADLETIKRVKPEILNRLDENRVAKETRAKKLSEIEGISEIRAAQFEWDNYHSQMQKFYAGDGGGKIPQKPSVNTKELIEKHPRAAAYLKADSYSMASNFEKAAAGRNAKERIISGDNPAKVLDMMEKEWGKAARRGADIPELPKGTNNRAKGTPKGLKAQANNSPDGTPLKIDPYAAAKGQRETPYTVNSGEMVSPIDSFKRRIRGEAPVKAPGASVQASKPEVGANVPQGAKQAENKADTRVAIKALEEEIEKQKLYNTQLYESMPAPSRADPSNKAAEPILDAWRASSKKLREMADELNKLKNEEVIPNTPDNSKKPFVNSFGEATKREITNAGYEKAQNKLSKEMMSFVGGKQAQKGKSGRWSIGADTARPEKTVDELVKEHGAIPKGEQPRAREVDVPKKTNYGDVQKHARTLQESAVVDDTLFKEINDAIAHGTFTRPSKGNKTAVDNANSLIKDKGIDGALERFSSVLKADKAVTSEDIALGNRVLQDLQKAGRYDEALEVATDLSQMLSETGRTLQAAKILKRLTPEGRLMSITKTADKLSKKYNKKITISDETVEKISKAKTEKEIVEANQKAAVEMWDQTPAKWMDKVNSWRYIAMLFNPKTHMRNVVGNALFVPAREFKNLIGTGLEKGLIKNGERTKAVLNPTKDKDLLKFANDDFKNVKSILKNEGKVDDNVRKIEAKVFDTKTLEKIRKLNLNFLDAEDTWFMQFAYDSSLAQYMKANKLKPADMVGETLEKGRKYAMNEALKATYRDFNALARLISKGKVAGASGKYGAMGKAGSFALEGAVPFAKTPMNLIKRGVGYSPANVVRGIVNLNRVKSGKVTATEAIDQLASGLSGSALVGLGMTLGYYNIVSGQEGEYRDKAYQYNQMLGSQNYALNVDGTSYTLDWAAPLSMPFFVGVELSNAVKDNSASLGAVLDSMTSISDPMVNMSMLQGINNIFKTFSNEGPEAVGQVASNIAMGYLGQFNPTLFGQIARTTDSVRRSTISTAESSTLRGLDKYARKQVGKIPGASQKLEPYIDLWGREQKGTGIVENFLSPGYFKKENVTEVDKEIQKLMENLNDDDIKKILPTSSAYQYTIESNKKKYRMTEKESTAYQKTRGRESYNNLEKLFDSSEYKKMTSEEKTNAIEKVYDAAKEKAEYNYFKNKGLSVTLAMKSDDQAKYENLRTVIHGERYYQAVADMRTESTDIAKVYAVEQNGKVADKFYSEFNISAKTVNMARTLKQAGLTAEQYTTAKEKANTNQNANVSKAEASAYLNKQNLSRKQKFILMKALVPNLKDQNNPYR